MKPTDNLLISAAENISSVANELNELGSGSYSMLTFIGKAVVAANGNDIGMLSTTVATGNYDDIGEIIYSQLRGMIEEEGNLELYYAMRAALEQLTEDLQLAAEPPPSNKALH
jgi:hypothetical protein